MKRRLPGPATSWRVQLTTPPPTPDPAGRGGRLPSPPHLLALTSGCLPSWKDPRDDIRPLRVTKGDRPDAGSLNLNPSGHVATTLTGSRGQAWASAAPEPSRRSLRAEEAAVLARPASRKRRTYAPAGPRRPPPRQLSALSGCSSRSPGPPYVAGSGQFDCDGP